MSFISYPPADILRPFVKSFAIQEAAEASAYRVLPDTGLVIGFQFKGRLARISGGSELPLAVSGISGLADQPRTFKNSPDIGTVLVFFTETGAAQFFTQPLHELFRESVSLDKFMLRSQLSCLEERLAEATSNPARIAVVEQFLVSRLRYTEPDKLVAAALSLIYKSQGAIRIRELAKQLHSSQSPLEKRFRQAVGATPKKFASIVRIKHVISQYNGADSLTGLGYEAGFYDQAHFIKEFRSFTGDTPEKFFSSQP